MCPPVYVHNYQSWVCPDARCDLDANETNHLPYKIHLPYCMASLYVFMSLIRQYVHELLSMKLPLLFTIVSINVTFPNSIFLCHSVLLDHLSVDVDILDLISVSFEGEQKRCLRKTLWDIQKICDTRGQWFLTFVSWWPTKQYKIQYGVPFNNDTMGLATKSK